MARMLKNTAAELLAQLPRPASAEWPAGEFFIEALRHGTMSVEIYAPRGNDPQFPHEQDELYFVHAGTASFVLMDESTAVGPGTVLFVPAHREHRFENLSPDFAAWVVFWGPPGGEAKNP